MKNSVEFSVTYYDKCLKLRLHLLFVKRLICSEMLRIRVSAMVGSRPLKAQGSALGCLLITLLAVGRAHAASRARSDRPDSKYRRDTVSDLGTGACIP